MNIGYACITVGVPYTVQKTCRLKNADDKTLNNIIWNNLNSLYNILNYNLDNNIKLFRICSETIPFGSSPINTIKWWDTHSTQLNKISQLIKDNNIRVSAHLGQYSVLNSPNYDVVKRAIEDLEYHCRLLDCLKCNESCKLIIHIGGVYGDKKSAMERFIKAYKSLDGNLKKRITIENDDKFYNIDDVLYISNQINAPVALDVFHNQINPAPHEMELNYLLELSNKTFSDKDGKQKIHYSEQNINGRAGSHSYTLNCKKFVDFYNGIENKDIDIMLEVKDKNLSAIKCINAISEKRNIADLEKEWLKYKYKIYECAPEAYNRIMLLLNSGGGGSYPVIEFYEIIDEALKNQTTKNNALKTVLEVWKFFQNRVTDNQKTLFLSKLESFKKNRMSINPLKKLLWEYTVYFNIDFLLDSYYFHL